MLFFLLLVLFGNVFCASKYYELDCQAIHVVDLFFPNNDFAQEYSELEWRVINGPCDIFIIDMFCYDEVVPLTVSIYGQQSVKTFPIMQFGCRNLPRNGTRVSLPLYSIIKIENMKRGKNTETPKLAWRQKHLLVQLKMDFPDFHLFDPGQSVMLRSQESTDPFHDVQSFAVIPHDHKKGYMGVMILTAGLMQVPDTCKVKLSVRDMFMDDYEEANLLSRNITLISEIWTSTWQTFLVTFGETQIFYEAQCDRDLEVYQAPLNLLKDVLHIHVSYISGMFDRYPIVNKVAVIPNLHTELQFWTPGYPYFVPRTLDANGTVDEYYTNRILTTGVTLFKILSSSVRRGDYELLFTIADEDDKTTTKKESVTVHPTLGVNSSSGCQYLIVPKGKLVRVSFISRVLAYTRDTNDRLGFQYNLRTVSKQFLADAIKEDACTIVFGSEQVADNVPMNLKKNYFISGTRQRRTFSIIPPVAVVYFSWIVLIGVVSYFIYFVLPHP